MSAIKRFRILVEREAKWLLKKVFYLCLELLLLVGAKHLVFKLSERVVELYPSEAAASTFWLRSRDAINGTTILADIDQDLKTRFCSRPFEWLEVGSTDLFLCCSAWLPKSIGPVENPSAAWSGEQAERIRASILDKSFRYCSRIYCPYIVKGTLPLDTGIRPEVSEKPKIFNLCYDDSCDLSCPSCRTKVIVAKGPERVGLDNFYRSKISPMISAGTVVNITGSGDPFASKHFRSVILDLTSREDITIDLQTNGNLLNRRAWDELSLAGHVRRVRVSLDAAKEQTYNHVRRGGRMKRVLENVKFLVELRGSGQIDFVGIDIVMQARNTAEVTDMIEMARKVGVDKIRFNTIRNWGTYTVKEFQQESIHSSKHGNKRRLEEVYDSGIFNDPIVDEGNIRQALGYPYHPMIDQDDDVRHS